MYAILTRFTSNEKGTTGSLEIFHDSNEILFSCPTLELPWLNNQRNVSCVPAGVYNVIPHTSKKFGKCFWLQNVANRSGILIHSGNTIADIQGCILVGRNLLKFKINNDYFLQHSRATMTDLLANVKESFTLKIDNSIQTPF